MGMDIVGLAPCDIDNVYHRGFRANLTGWGIIMAVSDRIWRDSGEKLDASYQFQIRLIQAGPDGDEQEVVTPYPTFGWDGNDGQTLDRQHTARLGKALGDVSPEVVCELLANYYDQVMVARSYRTGPPDRKQWMKRASLFFGEWREFLQNCGGLQIF